MQYIVLHLIWFAGTREDVWFAAKLSKITEVSILSLRQGSDQYTLVSVTSTVYLVKVPGQVIFAIAGRNRRAYSNCFERQVNTRKII